MEPEIDTEDHTRQSWVSYYMSRLVNFIIVTIMEFVVTPVQISERRLCIVQKNGF